MAAKKKGTPKRTQAKARRIGARTRAETARGSKRRVVAKSGSAEQAVRSVMRSISSRASVGVHSGLNERPHYGTTLFIASCSLEMRMGTFQAYVFQDLIHKGYIVALCYGDIHSARLLHTRIHSSCVTSETLRGCDCDCSKQLEGALKRISEKGAGILFYLIQEGRGVGYVAKARDRMLVQACRDEISTFEAYAQMGLKKDYRNYEGISSIIHLLGVKAPLRVLTNNPDKVNALRELGVSVEGTEAIEFDAGPYNLAYLTSKAQSGHLISRDTLHESRRAIPPEQVHAFNPHALPQSSRFILCATYFLPMKPVDGEVLVSKGDYEKVAKAADLRAYQKGAYPLIKEIVEIEDERVLVTMERKHFSRYREDPKHRTVVDFVTTPYWFLIHAYYDIATGQDFVVLTHGPSGKSAKANAPVVRIHSESIFDRFPLTDVENRDKLKASAKLIMRSGWGLIVLLYNDGRGAGFGAHATDRMFLERGVSKTSDEAYERMGLPYDSRDYDAAMALVAHHVPKRRIQMVMNGPDSLIRKHEYTLAMHRHQLEVSRWIFLDDDAREGASR